ncbi:MAG: NAD-dependent deacylase [Phycisphaerales bacterium]
MDNHPPPDPAANPDSLDPAPDAAAVEQVRRLLASARSIAVITGAGVSAESNIPTYRDKMEGLWASFDPQTLATPEAFARDPETVTRWYDFRRAKCLEAQPNAGHLALARLESAVLARGGRFTLLTQNVDRLHHRAASRNVVELHGNIITWRCTRTGARFDDLPVPFPQFPMPSPAGGLLRPDVVWFGESLPEAAILAAFEAAESADVFLTVGTSAVVYPAAGFLQVAQRAGATTIEINRDPTPHSGLVDHALQGRAARILPMLV